jgi:hypothetical protein
MFYVCFIRKWNGSTINFHRLQNYSSLIIDESASLSLSTNNFAMCSLPQFPDNFFPLIGIIFLIPMRGKKLSGN